MSDQSVSPAAPAPAPARPGTACLGCRRRKLKCSRGSPCDNCSKADLPCIYTNPQEVGIKRKRGPYNKDKSARERHLEDVVRYLGSTSNASESPGLTQGVLLPSDGEERNTPKLEATPEPLEDDALREQLVKDALCALTKPKTPEEERRNDELSTPDVAGKTLPVGASYPIQNPPLDHVMRYLYLFRERVDPFMKILHWPTFSLWVIEHITNIHKLEAGEKVLIYSIYFAAIASCTVSEVRSAFNAEKAYLLGQYGRMFETMFSRSAEAPDMKTFQALLIYMTCMRRNERERGYTMLFSLGVQMAQLMGLHKDPPRNTRPLDAEIRRRMWWMLCANETRSAEEGIMRAHTIMQSTPVRFPLNLNDGDLSPDMEQMPEPRVGPTDISFALYRFKIVYLSVRLWEVRAFSTTKTSNSMAEEKIKAQQFMILQQFKDEHERDFKKYYSKSRPYDAIIMTAHDLLTTKGEVIIQYPQGIVKACLTNTDERIRSLQFSNHILTLSNQLSSDPKWRPWHWFTAQYVQWHSLAIILTELSESRDVNFAESAWAALEPFLANWDQLFQSREHEGAWDHVNNLIQRAKRRRLTILAEQGSDRPRPKSREQKTNHGSRTETFTAGDECNHVSSLFVTDTGTSNAQGVSANTSTPSTLNNTSPTMTHSTYSNGDPFADFDPEAFEQVFSSFDWDSLGPLDDIVGDFM